MSDNKPSQPKEIDVFNRFSHFNKLKIIAIGVAIALVLSSAVFFLVKIFSTYTISYETFGGTIFGEELQDKTYKFLDKTEEPQNLKKEGYYIAGYYSDKDMKTKFEFGKRVWNSKTVYVDWQPGYAVQLFLADGEDTSDRPEHDKTGITQDYVKLYYEQYVKPGSSYTLPAIYNTVEGNKHEGEQLLWYFDESAEGMPFETQEFTVDHNIQVFGRWFDTSYEKFSISTDGVLNRYLGECENVKFPITVTKIKDITPQDFQSGRWNTTNVADGTNYSAFDKVFEKLKRVIINPQCTIFGDCAFRNCSALEDVIFESNTLTSVGKWAFADCEGLQTLNLPTTTTTIGDRAFYRSGIKALGGTNNITTIGESAFVNCLALEVVEFSAVTSIGKMAFAGCYSLEKVIFNMNALPTTNVNSSSDNILYESVDAYIYVPESLVSQYQSTYPWSAYSSRILAIT